MLLQRAVLAKTPHLGTHGCSELEVASSCAAESPTALCLGLAYPRRQGWRNAGIELGVAMCHGKAGSQQLWPEQHGPFMAAPLVRGKVAVPTQMIMHVLPFTLGDVLQL